MSELTDKGFVRTRLADRITSLEAVLRSIFGDDIDLSPDSMDGQTVGILAESISNLDQLAEDTWNSFDPESAKQASLSRLVQLNGLRRIPGAHSTMTVTCVGQPGTTILKGALVKNTNTGAVFKSLQDATIPESGEVDVPYQSIEMGVMLCPAGTLKMDTAVYGWQSAHNKADAIPGRDEETDPELRIRRRYSTAVSSVGNTDSLYATLSGLDGVVQARVFENRTAIDDQATGIPKHGTYCVVYGGVTDDIAKAIWATAGAGSPLHGAITAHVVDSQGVTQEVKFSRPPLTPIHIVVNVKKLPGYPLDGDERIKQALVEWGQAHQRIGEDVITSQLYTPVSTVQGISIQHIYASTQAAPSAPGDVDIAFDAMARILHNNITVEFSV